MPTRLTVRQLMDPTPVVVPPDRQVGELLLLMNERRIGSVLVAEADGRLLGIFTERDLLRRVADAVPGWRTYPVADWMTRDPHAIGPEVSWEEAMTVMTRLGVRRLPVVDDGRLVGLLSTRMLMARRAELLNQQVEARTAELRRANDQLLARDQEVLYNLRAAGRLQMKLLPHAPPDWPEVKWDVHFAPLDHLGGDYYDFAEPTPDHLGFLIADASGHSVAAAMVAVLARFAFAEVSHGTTSPGRVLAAINQRLQGITEERFVTAFYGVFDRRSRVLRYASAGHPHPLRWEAATGQVKPLAAHGFLIGVVPDEVYAEKEVTLAAGDAICFFTDGLVEARNEIGELFGEERVTECLRHSAAGDEDLLAHLLACQRRFSEGVPMSDDMTVAVCRLPLYPAGSSPNGLPLPTQVGEDIPPRACRFTFGAVAACGRHFTRSGRSAATGRAGVQVVAEFFEEGEAVGDRPTVDAELLELVGHACLRGRGGEAKPDCRARRAALQ